MSTEIIEEAKRYYYRFEEIDGDPNTEQEESPLYVAPPRIEPIIHQNFFRRRILPFLEIENDRYLVLFAAILPAICFTFDPLVFKGVGILSEYRGFAWSLAGITIAASVATLALGPRFGAMNAAFAGLFLTSGLVSLLIGIALLPLSLIGTFMVIGLLGFTPLFSAVAMFRLSRRMIRNAEPHLEQASAVNVMMFTAFASFVMPYLFNLEFEKLLNKFF